MCGRKGNGPWKIAQRLLLGKPVLCCHCPLLLAGESILLGRSYLTLSAEMPVGSNTHNRYALCSSPINRWHIETLCARCVRVQECPAHLTQVSVEAPKACPVLTSWILCFALLSEGCIIVPITFMLPQTTRASSGASVLIPTRPWQTTDSGTCPRCHNASLSFSNCPGLEAWKKIQNYVTIEVTVANRGLLDSSEQGKTECYVSLSPANHISDGTFWHIQITVAPGEPLTALLPMSRSSACHGLGRPVSIATTWSWERVSYTGWMIKKKKTQNDLLFRDDNINKDLKPEPYIRRYYKFIKAQINKNTLHLASPFIVSKHFNIYDFIHNWQANDRTNILIHLNDSPNTDDIEKG